MRNTIILAATLLAIGCDSTNEAAPDASTLGEESSDLTLADCKNLPPAFSQASCPNPATMANDTDRKAKCSAVKTVSLNDFKNKLGKDPNCSDGWIFGPDDANTTCIQKSGKNICKLTAKSTSGAGWPANDTWSQCLNDWVVYCTGTFPDTMGIKGSVCFHNDLDYNRLPATSVTGREVCQNVKDGKFPAKCDDKFCKPKNKPATKKKSGGGACAMSMMAGSGDGSDCEPESWSCAACDPTSDPDCAYDASCGCEACDAGDENPECSEDLVCDSPTPTPSPTESPTPSPTESPTPSPTESPTPSPTVTPDPTPDPTVDPTPYPTVSPTPDPTVMPTPFPTVTPSATPFGSF